MLDTLSYQSFNLTSGRKTDTADTADGCTGKAVDAVGWIQVHDCYFSGSSIFFNLSIGMVRFFPSFFIIKRTAVTQRTD
jgi:hypothetical protein